MLIVWVLHKMVQILDFLAPFVSGYIAVRKKETVKINMVYTLERATITICLSESDIYNYSKVNSDSFVHIVT